MKEALKVKGLDGSLLFESKEKARNAVKEVLGELGKMVASNVDSFSSSEHYNKALIVFHETAKGVRCYVS